MVGGFTFDGIDIDSIGLTYAPELNNTYVYKPAAYKLHEQILEAHNGGYYYGETVQPKDFVLRCFYEGHHVLDGVMARIHSLFRRGRTGRLVFKQRPWCWYIATVVNVNTEQMLNFENGIVSITLRAYYPFARTDYSEIAEDNQYEETLLNNSAMLKAGTIACETSFATAQSPITDQQTMLVYNPGTEYAKVAVRIAGNVGTGVKITNRTTGQSCRFVAITPQICNGGYYVQTDALNGQTIISNGTVHEPAFLYHDYGFIELAPGYPAYRDVEVRCDAPGHYVKSDSKFTEDMKGRYIYFANGTSAKIISVQYDDRITVDQEVTSAINGPAQILAMNELFVSPDPLGGNISLTKLEFKFKPTFA